MNMGAEQAFPLGEPAPGAQPIHHRGSHSITEGAILVRLGAQLTQPLAILDLGCGGGALIAKVAQTYRARGWDPARWLHAADIDATHYATPEVPFTVIDVNRPLPFDDGSLDLITLVEVLEHSEAPYPLMREIHRVLKPGGRLLFSVPNVGHMLSRLSFLLTGFFHTYPPPSILPQNGGRLCGHIMPLPLAYWVYGLRKAGFTGIESGPDRIKRGAAWAAALLAVLWLPATAVYRRKINRYDAAVCQENAMPLALTNSWPMLCARSLVMSGVKTTVPCAAKTAAPCAVKTAAP